MKRISLFLLQLIFATWILFAGEKISFSITPDIGMLFGTVNEYVYLEGFSDSLFELSELNWNMNPIYYTGTKFDVEVNNNLSFGAEAKLGLPVTVGKMTDWDWMNYASYPKYAYPTNFSEHDILLNRYVNGKIHAGYKFDFGNSFSIVPRVSFQYQEFFFNAYSGTGSYGNKSGMGYKYPYNDEDESHITPKDWSSRERVITYQQMQFIPFAGLSVKKDFQNGLGFSFLAEISPYAWIIANDKHYSNDFTVGVEGAYYRDFVDKPEGFGIFNTEFDFYLTVDNKNRFTFSFSYFMVPTLVGESGAKSRDDEIYYYDGLGGASSDLFSVSFNYTYTF